MVTMMVRVWWVADVVVVLPDDDVVPHAARIDPAPKRRTTIRLLGLVGTGVDLALTSWACL